MGRLIFRPEDKELRRFVLVTGQDGVYVVVGWDYGYNIALPEFLDNPNGMGEAYFKPQGLLRPMKDFVLY